jgi:hypothetical protein
LISGLRESRWPPTINPWERNSEAYENFGKKFLLHYLWLFSASVVCTCTGQRVQSQKARTGSSDKDVTDGQ